MTGADEHGQKIAETAQRQGATPTELCDQYVAKFQARLALAACACASLSQKMAAVQELNARLNIANDVYNRTTSAVHKECCQLIFRKSLAAGDIYLGSYEGWCGTSSTRASGRHSRCCRAGTTCAKRPSSRRPRRPPRSTKTPSQASRSRRCWRAPTFSSSQSAHRNRLRHCTLR